MAPVDKVFSAWTNPQVLAQWFGPEGFTVTHTSMDLRIGGEYSIEIVSPNGKMIRHFGTYLDVQSNKQLIFTWILSDQDCSGSDGHNVDTLVTIVFSGNEQQTTLKLTHEKLPDQQSLNGHKFGWTSSLQCLETILIN